MLRKIIAGGPHRKTRVHDHHGNVISLSRFFRHVGSALTSSVRRVAFGGFPNGPWISYDGQRIIDGYLTKQSSVLEFGSGASTSWYADRAGFVLSKEDDKAWFDIVATMVGNRKNVVRLYAETPESYVSLPTEYNSRKYDLVMIDGSHRDRCLDNCWNLLAPNGIIYLDNSDKHNADVTGDIPRARADIFAYAAKHNKKIITITDFAPTQVFVSEATIMFN